MTLDKIHHIAINVADLEQAIKWYQGSFNCQLLEKDRSQAVLQFKNVMLTLVLPSKEPGHLAFEREDAETFGTLKERAEGINSAFVSDSTGNRIEIVKK